MKRQHRRESGDGRLALAAWTSQLGAPRPEPRRSRQLAHAGGLLAIVALLAYLSWRVAFTLPPGGVNRAVAWCLVAFEALPLAGLVHKAVTLWSIDPRPAPTGGATPGTRRVVVLIPTYNEPREVIAPTVAAACALRPRHQTWVLDDGDRPWVAQMCAALGARYISRVNHDDAKAGNINNALRILDAEEAGGSGGADIIAVLDCDHVPLGPFLTSTLGWFDDPQVGLVQGPQAFYNRGAFDDDGFTGEQGLFFNVLMPARHHAEAGPFWCGSTSLLRVDALRRIGGVTTGTITEDLHTTLNLIRAGWKTVYHHQTLAVGLAPETPDQYLLQRRRWGMGAMQILIRERLWAAKRWMSWRTFQEYLAGTLWWLEGIATVLALVVPLAVLASGARTCTASPPVFTAAFVAMFSARLWGAKRLLRGNIHWPTAFALRVMRVPVGLACAWWLVSRRSLEFVVTPKGGADRRSRGRAPRILWWLIAGTFGSCAYAGAGVAGWVPWRTPVQSTVASGLWLLLAGVVLMLGVRRIRAPRYATSRRNAPRITMTAPVRLGSAHGSLVDVSVGGAAVRLEPATAVPEGRVQLFLPGTLPVAMEVVSTETRQGGAVVSLRVADGDWASMRELSLWLFHTPAGAVPALPDGIPVVAAVQISSPDRPMAVPAAHGGRVAVPAPAAVVDSAA